MFHAFVWIAVPQFIEEGEASFRLAKIGLFNKCANILCLIQCRMVSILSVDRFTRIIIGQDSHQL